MKIEGMYSSVEEAKQAVERLRNQGYTHADLVVATNEEVRNRITADVDAEVATDEPDTDAHPSLWDSIKNFFTMDDSYTETDDDRNIDIPAEYGDQIRQGQIAVFIKDDAKGPNQRDTDRTDTMDSPEQTDMDTRSRETDQPHEPDNDMPDRMGKNGQPDMPDQTPEDDSRKLNKNLSEDDDETIELREERLDIETEKEKAGEVHIRKKVTEDKESVDVPVTKEEVTIEKKPVNERDTSGKEIELDDDEEIVIPVEEEKAKAKKETEVTEEVRIKKETKEDMQTVEDTVRREELEVDEDGDVLGSYDKDVEQPDDDTIDREISTDRFDEDFNQETDHKNDE